MKNVEVLLLCIMGQLIIITVLLGGIIRELP